MEAIIHADIASYLTLYPFLPSSLLKNPNFAQSGNVPREI